MQDPQAKDAPGVAEESDDIRRASAPEGGREEAPVRRKGTTNNEVWRWASVLRRSVASKLLPAWTLGVEGAGRPLG